MKADLDRIKAALQQLEQNPNSGDSEVTSNQDNTSTSTSKAESSTSSAPIPSLQPNRKAPTLPFFNSLDNSPSKDDNPPVVAVTPPFATLMEELQQVVQQIENLYMEGPIVDGWLDSYPCESTPSNDERALHDVPTPVEYVKAAGNLKQNNVFCEAPRSCYRLSGISATGQQWSYPCPVEQLPNVSLAIARYEKLLQLLDRKRSLDTRLKQL